MKFLWIKIENFKSFEGRHKLDLRSYKPGLYFIQGENVQNKKIGSNGVGKSNIFDAMHWCLYGTSVRGTPTTQLVPWKKIGNPVVELALRYPDGVTKIRRTYKPNSISIVRNKEEKRIIQEDLNEIVGLSSDAFQSSVVIGQFSRMFFDFKPREKLSMLTELMELDYWLSCAEKASATLSVLKKDRIEYDLSISRLETSILEIKKNISSLRDLMKKSYATDKEELSKKIQKLSKVKNDFLSDKKEIEVKVFEAKERIDKLTIRGKVVKAAIEKYVSEVSKIDREVSALRTEYRIVKEQKTDLYEIGTLDAKCTLCGQEISPEHRKQEIDRLTDKGESIKRSMEVLDNRLKKLNTILKKKEQVAENLRNKARIQDAIASGNKLRDIDRILKSTISRIEELKKEKSELKSKQSNFYRSRISEETGRLSECEKEREELVVELRDLEVMIERTSYWIKGFKGIRLFELNDILTSLQIEINAYLSDLGMNKWSVKLEIERETKKGNLNRGFRVMVDPGVGSKGGVKPWEVWSGGEGQRLRLAGTLALSNLILRQFNRTCNIQVWDEHLQWLSGSGKDDMLELLQDIAKQEEKLIFIIDHNVLDYQFDGCIRVVKDSKGSHIIQ